MLFGGRLTFVICTWETGSGPKENLPLLAVNKVSKMGSAANGKLRDLQSLLESLMLANPWHIVLTICQGCSNRPTSVLYLPTNSFQPLSWVDSIIKITPIFQVREVKNRGAEQCD